MPDGPELQMTRQQVARLSLTVRFRAYVCADISHISCVRIYIYIYIYDTREKSLYSPGDPEASRFYELAQAGKLEADGEEVIPGSRKTRERGNRLIRRRKRKGILHTVAITYVPARELRYNSRGRKKGKKGEANR